MSHGSGPTRLLVAVLLTIVPVALLAGLLTFGAPAVLADGPAAAQVTFDHPVSVDQALALAKKHRLEVSQVKQTFSVGGRELTAFLGVPPGSSAAEIRSKLAEGQQAFLQDMAAAAASAAAQQMGSPEEQAAIQNDAAAFKDAQANAASTAEVQSVVVTGRASSLRAIQRDSSVAKGTQSDAAGQGSEGEVAPQAETAPMAADAVLTETWVPEAGYVFTGASAPGGRYVQNWMWWDNTSAFSYTATYEHAFFLRGVISPTGSMTTVAYLDPRSRMIGGRAYPNWFYAASNLPYAYLDPRGDDGATDTLNNSNGIEYAIGSAFAAGIRRYGWYYTYLRTLPGGLNADAGRLEARLGHRNPNWCISVQCRFTDVIHQIVPAWNIPVPGAIFWRQ